MNKYLCMHFTQLTQTFTVLSGLDWTGLAFDPLYRTGLDQDHRLRDLDWIGSFQMNLFHTLTVRPISVGYTPFDFSHRELQDPFSKIQKIRNWGSGGQK